MTHFTKLLILLMLFPLIGTSQILIGNMPGNTVYSSTANIIEYTGEKTDDQLTAEIEGFDEAFIFSNRKIELLYLRSDSSKMIIKNSLGEMIFDTILMRNENEATAYLQIEERLISGGEISKTDLNAFDEIKVIYECPWMEEAEVHQFTLIITDINGIHQHYQLEGGKIPEEVRNAILTINSPNKIYIEGIYWSPIRCFEKVNAISLDIL